jgi:hypothetical protein
LCKIFWHFFKEEKKIRQARKDKRKDMKFQGIIFIVLGFNFSACYAQNNTGGKRPFSDVIISKQSIPFTAIVDSSSIIEYKNNLFTPTFRYKFSELHNLNINSILFTGFDANWQLHMSNIELQINVNEFHLPSNFSFVVHSPARIGIDSIPDDYDLMLEIITFADSTIEFNIIPDFSSQKQFVKMLEKQAKKSSEFIKTSINKDTLTIVSTADWLYYPFGKYQTMKEFENTYFRKNNRNAKCIRIPAENDSIFKVGMGHSCIEFIVIDSMEEENNGNRLEIVFAYIVDNEIRFNNKIHTGIRKNAFWDLFFEKGFKEDNINVVILESGLTGIWHYYMFKGGVLDTIQIKTDYKIKTKQENKNQRCAPEE